MMDPFSPRPGGIPDQSQRNWDRDQSPGRKGLWLLGAFGGIVGLIVILAAI